MKGKFQFVLMSCSMVLFSGMHKLQFYDMSNMIQVKGQHCLKTITSSYFANSMNVFSKLNKYKDNRKFTKVKTNAYQLLAISYIKCMYPTQK